MDCCERVCEILDIEATTLAALYEQVRRGLSATTIYRLEQTGLDKKVVLQSLGTPGTLRRRLRDGSRLSMAESDRAVRLAGIIAHAEEVFGSTEKALSWLTRPTFGASESMAPVLLVETSVGTEMVRERLYQIRHGIYV